MKIWMEEEKTINQYLDLYHNKYNIFSENIEHTYLYDRLNILKDVYGGKQLIIPKGELKLLIDKYLIDKIYHIGDVFNGEGETYILAQLTKNKVGLININSGQLWDYGIKVSDLNKITKEMLENIIGSEYMEKFTQK